MECGGSSFPVSEAMPEGITIRPAAGREELGHAYRRVYWSFRRRGYLEESPSEMHLSIFNAFPTTVTFVSVLRGIIIASATLAEDTRVGLPMDELYHEQLQELRDAGRKLAEAGMLADRRQHVTRTLPMLLWLMKRLFDYATLVAKASDICIVVSQDQQDFYERHLLFKPFGPVLTYPAEQGDAVLPMRLDLDRVRRECEGNEELWQQFFHDRTPLSVLESGYRMTCEDLRYFFVESTSVFREAPREMVDCLREYYPDCPWEEWLPPS